MQKKQKQFLCFAVIVIAVIVTMAGCVGFQSSESPAFRSDFIGTWERIDQSMGRHTLTFTSTTVKASNQTNFWNIKSISGDSYIISPDNDPGFRGTIHLKLVGDNLEIIDAYDLPNAGEWTGSENDWTGTWKRK